MRFDEKDIEILKLLQQDAKMPHKEVAKKLGLSVTPAYERIKKLEKQGFISKYVAVVSAEKLGFELTAYCRIKLKEHETSKINAFEQKVCSLPQVQECMHLSGDSDYLLKVYTKNMEDYQEFITQKLANVPNISNVRSSFVMKKVKEDPSINIL